jgi:hypothetical protein
VEHTSINPNKAAHIGHLRNAILGDTFVRLLQAAGAKVDIQNYIDNTGVQVADVVVGFLYLEKKGKSEIEALIAAGSSGEQRFDYYCWDLYAQVSRWYEESKENLKLRLQTLHDIERGGNEPAEIARLISDAIIRRHLETMQRLGIEYDFLPQESEILHLHFWESAFEQLKQKGVLYFETEGKNKGCWVMTRPGAENSDGETDEDAKVIVRSNGTVTYVGKDIAYHLWKFGLLGRDFGSEIEIASGNPQRSRRDLFFVEGATRHDIDRIAERGQAVVRLRRQGTRRVRRRPRRRDPSQLHRRRNRADGGVLLGRDRLDARAPPPEHACTRFRLIRPSRFAPGSCFEFAAGRTGEGDARGRAMMATDS